MLVEIFSDVVCPWCAIGRARFAKALGQFAHRDAVEVVHRCFELDPAAPKFRRGSMAEHLSIKYGMSEAKAQASIDHLVDVAAVDGLDFRFDRARPGNTFDAHRLLCLARDHALGEPLVDAFLHGFFTEGLAVGDADELATVAIRIGLDDVTVRRVLESDAYADQVLADQSRARSMDITGVPFFLIDGRFAIPGAQSAERFAIGLDRAWAKVTTSS